MRPHRFLVLSASRMKQLTCRTMVVALLLATAACTSVQPIFLEDLSVAAPERVRVVTAQDEISIADPQLDEEFLTGELLNARNQRTGLTWSTPLNSIVEMSVRTRAQGRTAVAVILGIPAAAYAIFLLAFLSYCESGDCG